MNNRDNSDITQMNTEISRAFRQLDSYAFYTAFPQLISRIVHPNASVFSTLKIRDLRFINKLVAKGGETVGGSVRFLI
ncbi:unnamed protein product [Nippostrongylus brasiliensis]|uniref:FAT domain-containing protein n=1 Tax=Nippostrongylus brasiliensis TaxID=27835 RepID=A0A0N4XKC9_NIPBR|nr:unnamed protein product [Nippostrongylus brasiliensis]